MIKRWIEDNLVAALAARRGVYLTGAMQMGKTALTKVLDLPNSGLSPDNDARLGAAKL